MMDYRDGCVTWIIQINENFKKITEEAYRIITNESKIDEKELISA